VTYRWKQLNREAVRDVFRERLLMALDLAAREAFDPQDRTRAEGATDGDLPRLFSALDVQIETLAERYNVALVD
jgi:hypothetical protein